jgi:hypothetical protein
MYLDENLRQVKDASLKVAQYIHSIGYETILVSGRTEVVSIQIFKASNAVLGFKNPKIIALGDDGNKLVYKEDMDIEERIKKASKFLKSYPRLFDTKLCYLDDYANEGQKIEILSRLFPMYGMIDAGFSVIASSRFPFLLPKHTFIGIKRTYIVKEVFEMLKWNLHPLFPNPDAVKRDLKYICDYIRK